METKRDWLKAKVLQLPLTRILLYAAIAFALILFLPKIIMDVPFYLLMLGILAVITLNGNSIMNEGGLDITTLLHFGITVVYGPLAGFAVVLLSTVFAIYLSKISTPIDFYIQKNFAKVLIQTAQLFFSTLFIAGIMIFFGVEIIYEMLPVMFILAFTAGRLVKGTLLVTFARVPVMKVFVTTVLFYAINWYVVKFLGMPYLNFLKGL